jgi:hypothetical protein
VLGGSKKMKFYEIAEGVGRITKQNQTVDVGPDEITKQAAKFGSKVDRDGRPPTLSKKVKGKSTNVLYNLGLAESYTRDQRPQIKNSQLDTINHTMEMIHIDSIIPVQKERIRENFKRQVDNIVAGNYKPIIVDCDNKIINGHHRYTALQMLEYTNIQVAKLPCTLEQILENFADGKVKGKSRPGRVKRSGASCNGSVTALRKRAKNASGEKAKMYHWCANMKSGRKKK